MRIADSFRFGPCPDPKCTALHVVLLDKDDEPFAVCAIGATTLPQIMEMIQNHLYSINAQED